MYYHLEAFMSKKPNEVILHVGTNDVGQKTPEEITHELVQLKDHVTNRFGITPIISLPTIRTDSYNSKRDIQEICQRLRRLETPIITHDNISDDCLGKEGRFPGLHLNKKGTGRLAMNFLSHARKR